MDSEDSGANNPEMDLVNYEPDELYRLLEKRQEDLQEAMGIMEHGIKMLQSSKQGDKPITLEELFQFVLRLFEDIKNGVSDLPEKSE